MLGLNNRIERVNPGDKADQIWKIIVKGNMGFAVQSIVDELMKQLAVLESAEGNDGDVLEIRLELGQDRPINFWAQQYVYWKLLADGYNIRSSQLRGNTLVVTVLASNKK